MVLEDASVGAASPDQWAQAAIAAMHRHGADRLVAEVNQGGDLVESVIRQIDPLVPYRGGSCSTAARRCGPSRWRRSTSRGGSGMLRGLDALEEQMCQMTARGYQGRGQSGPGGCAGLGADRPADDPARNWRRPQVRTL